MVTAVADEKALYTAAVGQLRHPHVEKHPVDALDFEDGVIGQDIAGTARYGHDGLRFGRAASRPTNRVMRFIHRTGLSVTVSTPSDRSPQPKS